MSHRSSFELRVLLAFGMFCAALPTACSAINAPDDPRPGSSGSSGEGGTGGSGATGGMGGSSGAGGMGGSAGGGGSGPCVNDLDCAPGYCLAGACLPPKNPGEACGVDKQCASKHCVDGVCCDTACDGACESCNGGAAPGTCSPDPLGSPGTPACAPFQCNGASGVCPTTCASNDDCGSGLACVNGACAACPPGSVEFAPTGVVDSFTVPSCASVVTIEAWGAQGGTTNGGKGARVRGDFSLAPGEQLGVAVGLQGTVNACGSAAGTASGGGGGGSFVWRVADMALPLIAAGGGGGGNLNWNGACIMGLDGVVGTDGTAGNGNHALGGVNGNGGAGNAPSGTGAGGGGWLTAGQNSTYDDKCKGGSPPPTFLGGAGSPQFGPGGNGGFGGGGGAVCGCGGGGGYSGGGGGEGSSCRAGGGGGGSYNAGTNQSSAPGVQLGNGRVVISWM